MLLAAARAHALVAGRDYCTDHDVLSLASPVIGHRLKMRDRRIDPERLAWELAARELERLEL